MKTREKLNFFVLAVLLVLLSSGIARAGGGNWQDVLNLLNNKRTDVGKEPVSVSHPEDIDMDGVLATRKGTEDILEDYGFTGLADALNCAGYAQTTWSEGFDCKNEIYDILGLMLYSKVTAYQYDKGYYYLKLFSVQAYSMVSCNDLYSKIALATITWSPAYPYYPYVGKYWEQYYPYGVLVLSRTYWKFDTSHVSNIGKTYLSAHLHFNISDGGQTFNVCFNGGMWDYYSGMYYIVKNLSWTDTGTPVATGFGEGTTKKAISSEAINAGGITQMFAFSSNETITHCPVVYPEREQATFQSKPVLHIFSHICSEKIPRANFTYSPEKPMVGGRIDFNASSSQGNIVDYKWDFGDGESGSGSEVEHIFKEPKIYDVNLTVTDFNGLTDSNSVELDLTLENGDLLLCRDKDSFFGNLGINFWTHVGIYHKQFNMVIEARAAPYWVVAFYPLSDWFFPNKTYVEVLRVETSQGVRNAAVDFAFAQVGKYYDLFTLLINGTKNKDDSDGLGWYCSELVWAAYLNASGGGIDFDPDMLAVSPDEIHLADNTKFWAAHLENEPGVVWSEYFCGSAKCPVDLEIMDPDDLVLNKQGSQIPEAIYQEIDTDGDGELDDFFAIPEPKEGVYLIQVIPEAGASPTDTFTLVVNRDVTTKVLAQDVQVQDIPDFPFVVTTLTSLSADMEIEPETLSLSSEGNWITCYIQFPEAYYIANIDSSTILLNGEIPPARLFAGDEEDIEQILMLKFDRSDLQKIIQPGNVELIVTGELLDGTPFECRDTIRVIE